MSGAAPMRPASTPLGALPQPVHVTRPEPRTPCPPGYPADGEVLFTGARIAAAVGRMADQINADYHGRDVLAVVVLHGGVVFAVDLLRRLNVGVHMETVLASSYRDAATRPGPLSVRPTAELDATGRHVLIIDDILDTGRTLTAVRELLRERGAASIAIAVLLDKPSRRVVDVAADYRGLVVPDVFVVGYGLDHRGRYRNLPDIVALAERAAIAAPHPAPPADAAPVTAAHVANVPASGPPGALTA